MITGLLIGLTVFTFAYADGASYLSNDAEACVNCHVMRPQFDAWMKGSHARAASCNDCHAPHDNIAAKLAVKGLNGFNHSWAFTTGRYKERLSATPLNTRVTEAACRHCHEQAVHQSLALSDDAMSCIRCHAGVGHNTRN
ncbi:MAG: cytochrome c nitrite reductase small subunit [Rhodothermales bacterium]|nr:cytochrome c nitrite reductase small subunit [Rhodothermales bacterium]